MNVAEAISQWRHAPFQRGSTDCTAFADFVVHRLTGRHYLPQYATDEQAQAIIRRHGGLSGAVTYHMGRLPVPAEDLEPGDVVYIQHGESEAIGVLSNGHAVTVTENGIATRVHLKFVQHGWKTWA